MMLPFGCNTSQPIPNILADKFFSKNGQVKFWPDNENVGSVLKKIGYFSLTARSQQKRTMTHFHLSCRMSALCHELGLENA